MTTGSHTLNGMDPLRAVKQERKAEKRIQKLMEHTLDPFADDTPLVCGVENPESCESCQ